MASFWKEFREFLSRGNVIDLAVGIIIGGAFNQIVKSLVDDILMPPLGILFSELDFSNLYINLSSKHYPSLAAAQQAGAPTINYGLFLSNVLNFLIVGFVIFLLVRTINRLHRPKEEAPAEPITKSCPYCLSEIPRAATKCAHCTADLSDAG